MVWLAATNTGLVLGLIMAFCVLGLAVAYRLFNFPDLTIEGSFLLGAVGVAIAQKHGLPLWISFIVAMLLGALAGALTAYLHTKLKVNKFLAGIIVGAICYTAGLRLMGASNIGLLGVNSFFDELDALVNLGPVAVSMIFVLISMVALVGVVLLLIMNSRLGLRLRVAGSNAGYAKSLGVGVVASMVVALALTNALAAFSGAMLAIHQGFADINLGQGTLIFALASMSVGERLIQESKLTLVSYVLVTAVLGSVVYQLLMAFAIRAGLNPVDLKLVTAMFVLALIALRVRKADDAALQ